jgi:MFS transporter, DHA1 family, multidrug resistance protein
MTEPNTGAEIEQNNIQSDNSRRNSFVGDGLDPETARVPAKGRRQLESYPSAPLNREKYVLKFDGTDDVTNPQNWPPLKKLRTSAIGAYSCWCATFASALWSPATKAVGRHFNVSPETGILTTSLFLLGFAFGPATWGPLSELCGRRLPISLSMFGFVVFSAGTAAANDLQTVIICRFFTGVMGSCPLVVVPGILSDIYNHEHRGIAIAVYIFCLIMG